MKRTLILLSILCACNPELKTLEISHLTPNELITNTSAHKIRGQFSNKRHDFFVIKNYNNTNEQHKIAIDSFVVDYLKKNPFLNNYDNSSWRLTFFKYGNGIDAHTKHEYNTDYTIHNLFAADKEICNVYFNTRVGYLNTRYQNSKQVNRSIIVTYFKNNPLKLSPLKPFTEHLTTIPKKKDTLKVVGKFLHKEIGENFHISSYKIINQLQSQIAHDTIQVWYNSHKLPVNLSEKYILTLLEPDLKLGEQNHYFFPNYDGTTYSVPIE